MKHADPEKLKEAMPILRDSVPDTEYPVGTILQLVPNEAMVKHPHEKFPKTNGWAFFFLEVSKEGTKIQDQGDNVVNASTSYVKMVMGVPQSRSMIRRLQRSKGQTPAVPRNRTG